MQVNVTFYVTLEVVLFKEYSTDGDAIEQCLLRIADFVWQSRGFQRCYITHCHILAYRFRNVLAGRLFISHAREPRLLCL